VVIVSAVVVAGLAGLVVVAVARRWPRVDVGAPHVDQSSASVQTAVATKPRLRALLRREIDPAAATALVVTVAVAVLVAVTASVGLLLVMIDTHSGLAKWDLSFARWGAENATPTSTRVLRDISQLGGTLGVLTIATVVGVLEYRRRPNRALPGLLLLTVLGQFAVANVIKAAVGRARPDISQLTGFSGSSFPSGHAAAAAATFAVLAIVVGRGRSRVFRDALAAGAVSLAVLVAASRVLLGVHWFTDVLAGLAIGWGWLAVCSIAFGGRLLHFGAPVAAAEEVAQTSAIGEADT
jgi:undecaprenyl-diphosphatase